MREVKEGGTAEATRAWSDLDCFALTPLAPRAASGRATATADTSPGHLASLVIDPTLYADGRPVLGLPRLLAPLGAPA